MPLCSNKPLWKWWVSNHSLPPSPLPCSYSPLHSLYGGQQALRRQQPNRTGQDAKREGKDSLMWRLEGAQSKGRVQGTSKEVGDPPAAENPTRTPSKGPLCQSILLFVLKNDASLLEPQFENNGMLVLLCNIYLKILVICFFATL